MNSSEYSLQLVEWLQRDHPRYVPMNQEQRDQLIKTIKEEASRKVVKIKQWHRYAFLNVMAVADRKARNCCNFKN